jgi:phage repressor protein C with HTH and peptisase S24 domain
MSAPMARRVGKVTIRRARFLGLGARAYACTVDGKAMAPLLHDGDLMVIDPDRIPAAGDTIILWPADRRRRPCVRQLADQYRRTLHVETVSPASRESVHRDSLTAVHVVVGALKPEEVDRARHGPDSGKVMFLPPPHLPRCEASPTPRAR